jgi:hypothetical protein
MDSNRIPFVTSWTSKIQFQLDVSAGRQNARPSRAASMLRNCPCTRDLDREADIGLFHSLQHAGLDPGAPPLDVKTVNSPSAV